ncbi:hypothetical protein C0J52_22562, partial [Blattella germanica]
CVEGAVRILYGLRLFSSRSAVACGLGDALQCEPGQGLKIPGSINSETKLSSPSEELLRCNKSLCIKQNFTSRTIPHSSGERERCTYEETCNRTTYFKSDSKVHINNRSFNNRGLEISLKYWIKQFLKIYDDYKSELEFTICMSDYFRGRIQPFLPAQFLGDLPMTKSDTPSINLHSKIPANFQPKNNTMPLLNQTAFLGGMFATKNSNNLTTKPIPLTIPELMILHSVTEILIYNILNEDNKKFRPPVNYKYSQNAGGRTMTAMEDQIFQSLSKYLALTPGAFNMMTIMNKIWHWFLKLFKHQIVLCSKIFILEKFWKWIG